MIRTQRMADAAKALYDEGECLVTADLLADYLADAEIDELQSNMGEGKRLKGTIKEMIRDRMFRDVDDRFPRKVVAALWKDDNTPEDPQYVAVAVPERVVELWDQLSDVGLRREGRNFQTDGGWIKLIPNDFLPGRYQGSASALLFFPPDCSWKPILEAYDFRRKSFANGVKASQEVWEKKTAPLLSDHRRGVVESLGNVAPAE